MKLGTNTISTVKLGTNQVQKVYLGTNEVWANTDPDYQAILDYATTQGYTLPSAGQQTLQNQLVVDLKAAGVWSKLDTFAVFATDGNSDFALIDWIRLSQYTAVNSPTFTTNDGFTGNGTSSYIDTNFNPTIGTNNFTLNNACIGGVKNIKTGNAAYFLGCSVAGNNVMRGSSSSLNRINQTTFNSTPSADFSTYNFVALHRDSSTSVAYSYDNSITVATSNSVSIPNSNQWILRTGTIYANFGARMYFSGSNLIAENTDFYNAWINYYNAL
jgi:hypothetical protein